MADYHSANPGATTCLSTPPLPVTPPSPPIEFTSDVGEEAAGILPAPVSKIPTTLSSSEISITDSLPEPTGLSSIEDTTKDHSYGTKALNHEILHSGDARLETNEQLNVGTTLNSSMLLTLKQWIWEIVCCCISIVSFLG